MKVFYFLGLKFSITKFDSWKNQIVHVAIHAGIAAVVSFFNPIVGLLVGLSFALAIEILDGTKKVNREGRPSEGFNIFPDLVFRACGAVLGALLGYIIRGLI